MQCLPVNRHMALWGNDLLAAVVPLVGAESAFLVLAESHMQGLSMTSSD